MDKQKGLSYIFTKLELEHLSSFIFSVTHSYVTS